MKIKIFTMHDRFADDRKRYLEDKVNIWLEKNDNINIISTDLTSSAEYNLTYAITYDELKENNQIESSNMKEVGFIKEDKLDVLYIPNNDQIQS